MHASTPAWSPPGEVYLIPLSAATAHSADWTPWTPTELHRSARESPLSHFGAVFGVFLVAQIRPWLVLRASWGFLARFRSILAGFLWLLDRFWEILDRFCSILGRFGVCQVVESYDFCWRSCSSGPVRAKKKRTLKKQRILDRVALKSRFVLCVHDSKIVEKSS